MLLTIFLTIVFCAAITLMLFSAIAFIQDKKFFSSAPQEAQEAVKPREEELFYGARAIGWTLMIFSFLMIGGVGVISIWDGIRSDYTFIPSEFVAQFDSISNVYAYDSTVVAYRVDDSYSIVCGYNLLSTAEFVGVQGLLVYHLGSDCRGYMGLDHIMVDGLMVYRDDVYINDRAYAYRDQYGNLIMPVEYFWECNYSYDPILDR